MKISKVCSLELIVLLICWMCFLSEGHLAKKTRGYRDYRRREDTSQADNGDEVIRRALKGMDTPTVTPTFDPTTDSKEDKEQNEEEPVLEAAEKGDKEEAEEEETNPPTASPTVEETTEAPTFPPTTEATETPMVVAKEDKETPQDEEEQITDSPTAMPTVEQTTESPTLAPTTTEPTGNPTTESTVAPTDEPTAILVSEANEFTVNPAVAVTNSPATSTVDETSSTSSPTTGSDATIPQAPTTPSEGTTVGPTSAVADPYYVRLEPLYMTLSLSEGDFNQENFMDVLIDYMEYNMVRDLEHFESITYGVSTFSQLTLIPNSIERSQNTSTAPDTAAVQPPIVSNITVHIHLLTSKFAGTPTQPDLVITEYMEMLLENGELFQEYIEAETLLDAKIQSITLEFEETVQPTNVQDNTSSNQADSNAATAADGDTTEEDETSIWQIVGITIGCFVALLWMVFLWGIQSRAAST